MNRREVIAFIGAATVARAGMARAQGARKVARIGIFTSSDTTADISGPQPRARTIAAFLRGMSELGYVYGRDFVTEARGGESTPSAWPKQAAELATLEVDAIVAGGPTLPALQQVTRTIPVIMTGSIDPVGQGFVQSLRSPGGNFTGMTLQLAETAGKRLELLRELVGVPTSVAVFWDALSRLTWEAVEAAARVGSTPIHSFQLRDAIEVEAAFTSAKSAKAGALLVFASAVLLRSHARVVELAAANRIPAMYELRQYVDAGGLVSYSTDLNENYRRAAVFVDKILKGARPQDLPIEQPTKFELVINLKTARTLGLTIPPSLFARADEVIE